MLGLILGIVFGVIFVLCLAGLILFVLFRRKSSKSWKQDDRRRSRKVVKPDLKKFAFAEYLTETFTCLGSKDQLQQLAQILQEPELVLVKVTC